MSLARQLHRRELERQLAARAKPAEEPRAQPVWPDGVDVGLRLKAEAEAIATRLGHEITQWIPQSGAWRSRCLRSGCYAGALVTPRAFRRAPITGEAVTFACEKRKR